MDNSRFFSCVCSFHWRLWRKTNNVQKVFPFFPFRNKVVFILFIQPNNNEWNGNSSDRLLLSRGALYLFASLNKPKVFHSQLCNDISWSDAGQCSHSSNFILYIFRILFFRRTTIFYELRAWVCSTMHFNLSFYSLLLCSGWWQ